MKPLDLFREDIDWPSDPYAYAMDHLFGICGALYRAGESIPTEWHYRPSPLMAGHKPDPEDDATEIAYSRALKRKRGGLSADDLRQAGRVLSRYVDSLEAQGRTY